jgi:hypothetical protein
MNRPQIFVSPSYPVLYAVAPSGDSPGDPALLSLALLVGGVPSFLATLPVDGALVDELTGSLDAGDVRVSVTGIAVDADEVAGAEAEPDEPWRTSIPAFEGGAGTAGSDAGAGLLDDGAPAPDDADLPAAFLGLVCEDGRRVGVARIVSRDRRATPDDVARYVLEKITSGVQIPDLASAG